MICPHKWLTIDYMSSAGQGSSPAKRPMFYRYSTTHSSLGVRQLRNVSQLSRVCC